MVDAKTEPMTISLAISIVATSMSARKPHPRFREASNFLKQTPKWMPSPEEWAALKPL